MIPPSRPTCLPGEGSGSSRVRGFGLPCLFVLTALALLALPSRSLADAGDKVRGYSVFQRSILARVMPDSVAAPGEGAGPIRLQAAWDQREAAQIAVHASRDLAGVNLEASDLRDDKGHAIPASAVDLRMERFYAVPLSIRYANRIGVVPKTLEPAAPLSVPAGSTRPWWITVHVPDGAAGGVYRGRLTIHEKKADAGIDLEVDVLPRRLDDADAMLGPWSVPVLRDYPRATGADADRMLRHADLVFRDIREHGMTSMGLWSGNVSRKSKDGRIVIPDLDAALDLYGRYAFPQPLFYAPVNLLSTNKLKTSSNYTRFDADVHVELAASMARDYTRQAAERRLPGLVFAPIEEPNLGDGIAKGDAPDTRQRIATELLKSIKGAGGRTAMTCTPETARLGGDNLDYRIVAYKKFEASSIAEARAAKAHPGLYANATLMGNGTFFSRFFFGYFPWATKLDAMMAWTYPSLPKRFPENRDNRAEGPLHVTDGFLGSDGRPVPVIQWELAREGVDDFRYVVTLTRLAARAAKSKNPDARRTADEASAFLASLRASVSPDAHRYAFENPDTFEPTPAPGWDDARFTDARRRSFELLKRLVALDDAGDKKN